MNKYYCTGEVLENGYLKVVVPTDKEPVAEFNGVPNHYFHFEEVGWNKHIESLPLAALVVGGKTGWLEGYEERYERYFSGVEWHPVSKSEYESHETLDLNPDRRRIVLVKKPEEKSEGNYVEKILHGIAPCHSPTRSYREVVHGLKAALLFADKVPNGSALTGWLCEVANLIWDYENMRIKSESPVVEDRPQWVKAGERFMPDPVRNKTIRVRFSEYGRHSIDASDIKTWDDKAVFMMDGTQYLLTNLEWLSEGQNT